MKKKILNILTISAMLTIIGFLMDGDVKEPSVFKRFVEFFGMIGILFMLISAFYFGTSFMYKTFKQRSV